MAFFQNVFPDEYRGNLPLGDRQYTIEFVVPANKNGHNYQYAWNVGPYDFSVVNTLTLNYAWDTNYKCYSALAVNVAGAAPAATTAAEVVAILNANAVFADMFVAEEKKIVPASAARTVLIRSKSGRVKADVRMYVSNGGAETKLRFNKNAGVAELPTYFERHTIDNRMNADSEGLLVLLDETDAAVDQPIITDAGFDFSAMQEDWELLRGRSGLFTFRKVTVDGSNRITEIIEYPAGAAAGDFAKKTAYTYTAANTNPDQITEIPYTLTTGDLVTP